MSAEPEFFEKTNDYTLMVYQVLDKDKKSEPSLTRIFNFASRTVTHIFQRSLKEIGMTSAMHIQNFSDLGSLDEVRIMFDKLQALGGHPPQLPAQEENGLRKAPPPGLRHS